MTLKAAATATLIAAGAGMASAQAISIDSPGGTMVSGTESFTWMGLTFFLDEQPSGGSTAAHRVSGAPGGNLDFFLEAPGKVSYRATFASSPTLPTGYSLGFRYGADLTESTPAFSNMTGLFRRLDGGTEITQQMLAGSDAANPGSVFYGSTGRDATGGSMTNQAFLNMLGFGVDGTFEMLVDPEGTAQTSVTAAGASGSADFTRDLTPGVGPDPFTFNEIILQVESFQDAGSFGEQFGQTGQQFTFTSLSIRTIPTPGAAAAIGLTGLLATRRRRGVIPTHCG